MVQLMKYGIVTVCSYLFLIIGTYILSEIIKLEPSVSYFLVISFIYVSVYIANTKFVFAVKMSKKTAIKYIFTLIMFWLFNNIFFNIMTNIFNIHYIVAIFLNLLLFGFLRFLVQKHLVFYA